MALFKIFRGTNAQLAKVPHKEGYAYFTEDDGKLHIDISSDSDSAEGVRITVNAKIADSLKGATDGSTIDIDDIFLKNMTASVAQGGTGHSTLKLNALLVGNDDKAINTVSIYPGNIVVGDSRNGVAGIEGEGALYATRHGVPRFGVLPVEAGGTGLESISGSSLLVSGKMGDTIEPINLQYLHGNILVADDTDRIRGVAGIGALYSLKVGEPTIGTLPIQAGGTGATNSASARNRLSVYSEIEVDDKISEITTKAYSYTLSGDWSYVVDENNGSNYLNKIIEVPNLTCGKNGDIPPLITPVSNQEEYSYIDRAIAYPETGKKQIVFIIDDTSKMPTNDIEIIVIDIK